MEIANNESLFPLEEAKRTNVVWENTAFILPSI